MGNVPPPGPPSPGSGPGPDWGEMKDKLTASRGADRMILIAGLVFFIDSFLAWYGIGARGLGVSATVSGWNSGGLAVISILLAIAASIFAAIRVLGVNLDLGTVNDGVVYLALGGGALLFAVLRLVTGPHFNRYGLHIGSKYGLYIAIVAGAFLAIGGFQKYSARS